MSEWIKFSFEMFSETEACDLVMYLDGTLVESGRMGTIVDADHLVAKHRSTWIELSDDVVNGTGDHTIRINVVERLDALNGLPFNEYPIIDLVGIELSGSVHTSIDYNINSSIRVYNVLDDSYQKLIDDGTVNHDSQVTEDIGNGSTIYSVSDWTDCKVIGPGAWMLDFTCPYLTWYNAVHAD